MKPVPANVTARMGLWVLSVFVICSAFLFCNYLLVNQRLAAMERRLESLQRSEKPIPNSSFHDQRGVNRVLYGRDKRSVNQASSNTDFEKRLHALERRYFVSLSSARDQVVACMG